MPRYHVIVAGPSGRNLKRISQPWRDRIQKAVDSLEEDPFRGKKLQAKSGKWRIRVWPYRIVYYINKQQREVKVVEIGDRGSIRY
jgi:mRNA-degrading endonuclease RelE of RelBE toxin-antitoxin system